MLLQQQQDDSCCTNTTPPVRRSYSRRGFASKTKKNKQQQPQKKRSKASKRQAKQRRQARERAWRERQEHMYKLKRRKNLHPAAKMKRVLSAADYWFSRANLASDHYMVKQLRLYNGYIPLQTLLRFPSFEHWTDLEVLYTSFTNQAATKRYEVIVDKERIQKVKQLRIQRKQARKEWETLRLKKKQEAQKQAKKRRNQQRIVYNERLQEVIEKLRQPTLEHLNKLVRQDLQEHLEKQRNKHAQDPYSLRGMLERRRRRRSESSSSWAGVVLNAVEKFERLLVKPIDPQFEEYTLQDINDELVYEMNPDLLMDECEFLHDGLDYQFAFEDMDPDYVCDNDNDSWDLYDSDHDHEMLDFETYFHNKEMVAEISTLSGEQEEREKTSISTNEKDADNDVNEEAVPENLQSDNESESEVHANDLQYALVRHRRVNLQTLDSLFDYNSNDVLDDESYAVEDSWHDDPFASMYGQHAIHNDVDFDASSDRVDDSLDNEDDLPKKTKGTDHYKKYTTTREVVLIQNGKKLTDFCNRLRRDVDAFVKANGNDPRASAIGFDVEYATLDMDIRNTLPAMLQLAGPSPNSQVGLVWLDRFPNHGQEMIGHTDYEALLKLLADSKIQKVGVGATKDANHLAAWWGINDAEYTDHYIAGVVNLEEEEDESVFEKSLAEMAEIVLERKLPKRKQVVSKRNKKRKKQGKSVPTAHWRVKSITKEMKEYAAHDASSGIDIWIKLNALKS